MRRLTRRRLLLSALAAMQPAKPLFEELPPSRTGITWVHDNAMSPNRYMPESIGPGCAWIDYDNDGWMDLYLVNYGPAPFWQPSKPIRNALYRNNRDGTFTDVTEKAGVAGGFFGMGAAVGDFDSDGHPDLLVTGYNRVALYRNRGDGTFDDVTKRAGLDNLPSNWPTSAVWFDYDNDGRLDLFLCNYLQFEVEPGKYATCGDNKLGRNYYCVPRVFNPTSSMLYHNNGDGTFTLASAGTEIAANPGKALGVVATDINNDGLMDLWVACDTSPNLLFVNRGRGADGKWQWEETGLAAHVAYSENGQARSGMGVDAADFDNDGWEDLFVSNIDQEMYALYKNNRDETFIDVAHRHGVAQGTRLFSGWGLKFFDYDNDGNLDLILANSHPDDMIEQYSEQIKYKMPMLLFRHDGERLRNVSAASGPVFAKALSARGLAIGDFNNDGLPDVLVACNGEAPVLLQNHCQAGNSWAGLHLEGATANRDAIGARITWSAGGVKRSRLKTGGGSYLSSHDPRMILGCGTAEKIDWVEIRWPAPSKRIERIENVPLRKYSHVVEGKGIVS
jgi:enediyne biosynthesis protein E4